MLWQTLLARALRIRLGTYEPLLLAMSVWFVYFADHAMDAMRPTRSEREPARKMFHRLHLSKILLLGPWAAVLIAASAMLLLRAPTLYGGLELGGAIVCYLGFIHLAPISWRGRWPRELAVALLFAVGTCGAVWAVSGAGLHVLPGPLLLLCLLLWVNCCAIENWEWQWSGRDPDAAPSFAAQWVSRYLNVTAGLIALLAAVLGWTALIPGSFALAGVLSGLLLCWLAFYRARLSIDLQTAAADLALCTPALLLVFNVVR